MAESEASEAAGVVGGVPVSELRVAVLGAGKLGGILVAAFLKSKLLRPNQLTATVGREERAQVVADRLGIKVTTDNVATAAAADVILLGMKPGQIRDVVAQIRPSLTREKLLISFAAGVGTRSIEDAARCEIGVVWAMPNTPAAVGEAMTALCAGRFCSEEQMALAQRIFDAVGRTVVVDEKQMDAVTGLSGSGPAFLYLVIEALADAGVNSGLPRATADLLAAQTTLGAARMVLETGSHPAVLKNQVTTPAGCTVDGLLALEEGGLRATLIKAVKASVARSRQLAAP